MTAAKLEIIHAGPQVSLQDEGRFGLLRYGVPASGPMDRFAFTIANLVLGNSAGSTCIEISLGGLTLRCALGPVSFAVAGGDFRVFVNETALSAWSVACLQPGDTLQIRPGRWGSWCYLAFSGKILCNQWLGSASTHGPSGLGGRILAKGSTLAIENAQSRPDLQRPITCPVTARARSTIRVVLGPQDRFFNREMIQVLLSNPFTLTHAYDRMGVRLSGPSLRPNATLDMPSEGITRGSIQVAGDGVATVLLADHQTTGGYPKIATILSIECDGFSQLRSHDSVVFEAISTKTAISAARTRSATRAAYLEKLLKNT